MKRMTTIGALIGALALLGCPAPTLVFDFPGDPATKIADMTDAHAAELCTNVRAVLGEYYANGSGCMVFGAVKFLAGERSEATCERTVAECRQSSGLLPFMGTACGLDKRADRAECPVTLAEMQRCFNDRLLAAQDYTDAMTCSDASTLFLARAVPSDPASCLAIERACPKALR